MKAKCIIGRGKGPRKSLRARIAPALRVVRRPPRFAGTPPSSSSGDETRLSPASSHRPVSSQFEHSGGAHPAPRRARRRLGPIAEAWKPTLSLSHRHERQRHGGYDASPLGRGIARTAEDVGRAVGRGHGDPMSLPATLAEQTFSGRPDLDRDGDVAAKRRVETRGRCCSSTPRSWLHPRAWRAAPSLRGGLAGTGAFAPPSGDGADVVRDPASRARLGLLFQRRGGMSSSFGLGAARRATRSCSGPARRHGRRGSRRGWSGFATRRCLPPEEQDDGDEGVLRAAAGLRNAGRGEAALGAHSEEAPRPRSGAAEYSGFCRR